MLVNNAALDSPPDAPAEEVGPFEDYPEQSFDAVMDVNVKGTFLCCQAVGAAMAREGRGSIVNVSSVYGLLSPVQDLYDFRRAEGETYFKPVAYSVSKSAVLNLTRYLATYWAEIGRPGQHAHARRRVERPAAGVPRRVRRAVADGADARRARGARRSRVPRLGRVLVRHRLERRRRRRLVGVVAGADVLDLIGGKEVPAGSGAWLEKIRPSDEAVMCRVARSGADDVAAAVAAAREAQPAWAERTAVARGDVLRELALLLRGRREEASALVAEETGKPEELALGETDAAVEMGLFIAGEGRRSYGRTTTASMPHRTVLTLRQPLGVAALIMSFNTPLPNVAWKAFPSMFCGNASVVKPSEHTPASAAFFARLALEAGVPPGVLNVVQGLGDEAGAPLVAHPDVDLVSFTGSAAHRPRDQRGRSAAAREDVPRARRQERARRLR